MWSFDFLPYQIDSIWRLPPSAIGVTWQEFEPLLFRLRNSWEGCDSRKSHLTTDFSERVRRLFRTHLYRASVASTSAPKRTPECVGVNHREYDFRIHRRSLRHKADVTRFRDRWAVVIVFAAVQRSVVPLGVRSVFLALPALLGDFPCTVDW